MANVLVTGATGFIAGHLILALLAQGHQVRGTARSTGRQAGLNAALSAYSGQAVDVELVAADLSSDAGWAEAVAGMDVVHHVASPLPTTLPKDPDELIVPARDGALRVLRAARDAGVRRVVMTSSTAAITYGWGKERPPLLDERHWTNPDQRSDNTAYTRSKAIAERAAWDWLAAEGGDLELVCINPSAVLGPVMGADFSASLEILTQLLGGKLPAVPRVGFQIVDVRDVAAAHVLAQEVPEAAGERFLVCEEFWWFSEIADLLRERFPEHASKLPRGTLPGWLLKVLAVFNPVLRQVVPELDQQRMATADKARAQLGWASRGSETAIIDGAQSLIRHGVV